MKFLPGFALSALACALVLGCGMSNVSTQPSAAQAVKAAPVVAEPAKATDTVAAVVAQAAAPAPAAAAKPEQPQRFEPGAFEDPKVCSTCHSAIYEQWSKSMHAYAWTDQWYQPDYLLAHQQTNGATDTLCGACHAPIAARTGLLPPADGSKFDEASKRGISCDFCHTVSGVGQMFNMGHISAPGPAKIGPRGDGKSLYHEVKNTGIHNKADFCGSCHMVIHPATGTHIIDTWEDWKNNDYGKQNITCQNCHMTPTPGVTKAPGRAALMGIERDNIAFHGFVGGSSYAQDHMGNKKQAELSREMLRSAAEVKLADKVNPDGTLELTVDVFNKGAGHKIPTGTTYIRIMWLQVEVADQAGKVVYSSGQVDKNNHVDPNAVFFRVLFRDADGKLTGKSWQAHGIGYDRRIPAKGKETEVYRIPLPAKGEYKVTTRLMYRSMTQESLDEVLKRTGQALPPVVSVEMAAAKSTVKF